jgi:hypothetical protein
LRSETKSLLRTLDKGSRFAPEPKLMDISLIQKSLEFESDFSFNVVDLRQSFCSSDICTIAEDGKEYFIYGNHLSNVGNQVITSQILEIFEKYILMKRLQK